MLYQVPQLPSAFLQVVERVDEMRLRLKFMLQQAPRRWTGLLRRSTFARSIQGSNSIEGFQVTVDDAAAAVDGEEPLDEKTEAWYAVRGYREAMTYVLQLADDPHFVYHEAVLRGLHFMMTSYDMNSSPGRWRPGFIYVKREGSGETVYEGPDAALVPELVAQLIEQLNARSPLPIMVRAALAHLNLVMIHPYSDGNGRMARALQTLVLAREGILDPAFSSIEEYLGHNTQAYYAVLAAVGQGEWHPEHDALPWVKFCLTAHFRQAQTLLRRTQETGRLARILEEEVKRRGLNERTVAALLDAAYGYRVRNTTYRKAADVSDAVSSRDLGALANAGLLIGHGAKRGRYYLAGDWVRQQRAQTDLPRVQTDPFSGHQVREERPKFVANAGAADE
ncbi:MAG: Fic family protein [Steroidobacteraceae bacterium]